MKVSEKEAFFILLFAALALAMPLAQPPAVSGHLSSIDEAKGPESYGLLFQSTCEQTLGKGRIRQLASHYDRDVSVSNRNGRLDRDELDSAFDDYVNDRTVLGSLITNEESLDLANLNANNCLIGSSQPSPTPSPSPTASATWACSWEGNDVKCQRGNIIWRWRDDDRANDPVVRGRVFIFDPPGTGTEQADVCAGSWTNNDRTATTHSREFSLNPNGPNAASGDPLVSNDAACPQGSECREGACIATTPSASPSPTPPAGWTCAWEANQADVRCSNGTSVWRWRDNDSANDPRVEGMVFIFDPENPPDIVPATPAIDVCAGASTGTGFTHVQEYRLDPNAAMANQGNPVAWTDVACPSGTECRPGRGACVTIQQPSPSPTQSANPSPSPTQNPAPSPSTGPSPTPTRSPSPSPTASSSPSPSPTTTSPACERVLSKGRIRMLARYYDRNVTGVSNNNNMLDDEEIEAVEDDAFDRTPVAGARVTFAELINLYNVNFQACLIDPQSPTPSPTPTASASPSHSPTPSPTNAATPSPSASPRPTASGSSSPSPSATATRSTTPSPTASQTATPSPSPTASSYPPRSMTVIVTDSGTGEVLRSATVYIYDYTGRPKGSSGTADGKAFFSGLKLGYYTARAAAPGYKADRTVFAVRGGRGSSITMALRKTSASPTLD